MEVIEKLKQGITFWTTCRRGRWKCRSGKSRSRQQGWKMQQRQRMESRKKNNSNFIQSDVWEHFHEVTQGCISVQSWFSFPYSYRLLLHFPPLLPAAAFSTPAFSVAPRTKHVQRSPIMWLLLRMRIDLLANENWWKSELFISIHESSVS